MACRNCLDGKCTSRCVKDGEKPMHDGKKHKKRHKDKHPKNPEERHAGPSQSQPDGRYLAIRVVMMPRDTNPMGTIFGGIILSHIDVAGTMEARRHSEKMLVTVAMHDISVDGERTPSGCAEAKVRCVIADSPDWIVKSRMQDIGDVINRVEFFLRTTEPNRPPPATVAYVLLILLNR